MSDKYDGAGGYKTAYEKLLKENTQLHAEVAMLKGNMQTVVQSLTSNVNSLDAWAKGLQRGLVQSLRERKFSDEKIMQWCEKNGIQTGLKIVGDEQDEFGKEKKA